jgi:protein-S-isoprenylcysteine O-methyltransferase Ste14
VSVSLPDVIAAAPTVGVFEGGFMAGFIIALVVTLGLCATLFTITARIEERAGRSEDRDAQ